MNIDTPAQHWRWLLEEHCYLVERGVRPMATVDVPISQKAEAESLVRDRGLHAKVIFPFRDLAGIECVELAIAQATWVLALYAWSIMDRPYGGAIAGLLHGYSVLQIEEFLRQARDPFDEEDEAACPPGGARG